MTFGTTTEGAEIYYTTDGSIPSKENGTKYTGAILVTGTPGQNVTTTIKAMAVKDGMRNSDVAEFTYTINLPKVKYIITANAGENGSILPSGAVEVEDGDSKTFTITPDQGYEIDSIKIDGESVDTVETGYTFTNVTSAHTIEVTFKGSITTIDISSVDVTIPSPEAGQAFENKGTAEATGLTTDAKTPNITWTTKDGKTVSGNAEFNTTYKASLTLSANAGGTTQYAFAENVAVKVNENAAGGVNADDIKITHNEDGTITISCEFTTPKAKLTEIKTPESIIRENGTAVADLNLPEKVTVITEDSNVMEMPVTWNIDAVTEDVYNPAVLTEQKFSINGTVSCLDAINPDHKDLSVSIEVTVCAADKAEEPTASIQEGIYSEDQFLELDSADDADIYYTTDGSVPSKTNGAKYTGAIPITGTPGQSETTTIKAVAVKKGMMDSEVVSFTYTINLPVSETYTVTINNGSGSGEYAQGDTVTITADAPDPGEEFAGWVVVSGEVTLASAISSTTTFEMPAEEVVITAIYESGDEDDNDDVDEDTDVDSENEEIVSAAEQEKNELVLNAKLKVSQTGSNINVQWGKVAAADGYSVYVQYCGKKFTSASLNAVNNGKVTKITVKKVNGKKLDLKKNYKVYVLAYKLVNGKKVTLGKTITAHIVGKNNTRYTNVKSVKVKKSSYSLKIGRTATIKAKTILVSKNKKQLTNAHAKEFRYATSNKKVAIVSAKGKITAVGKGICVVYVYARNGYAKAVKVTVK